MSSRAKPAADVVAVGASFAGLSFARVAALNGLDVLVVERSPEVGRVVRTTGVLCEEMVEEALVPSEMLTNRIDTVHVYSPSMRRHTFSSSTTRVFMSDTRRLIGWIADQARAAGARIETGAAFVGSERTRDGLDALVRRGRSIERIAARFLVGADGARSRVARETGLECNTRFIAGTERVLSDVEAEPNAFHIFFDRGVAPGYLGWLAPADGRVAVGVAGFAGARPAGRALGAHLERIGTIVDLSRARVARNKAGLVPVNQPLRRTSNDRCLLVGDAAGVCGNLGLDGIFPAVVTGSIAGRWVAQYLLAGRRDALASYEAEWREHDRLGRWLEYQSFLRALYDAIATNEGLERLFDRATSPAGLRLCQEAMFHTFMPAAGPRMLRVFAEVLVPGLSGLAALGRSLAPSLRPLVGRGNGSRRPSGTRA